MHEPLAVLLVNAHGRMIIWRVCDATAHPLAPALGQRGVRRDDCRQVAASEQGVNVDCHGINQIHDHEASTTSGSRT